MNKEGNPRLTETGGTINRQLSRITNRKNVSSTRNHPSRENTTAKICSRNDRYINSRRQHRDSKLHTTHSNLTSFPHFKAESQVSSNNRRDIASRNTELYQTRSTCWASKGSFLSSKLVDQTSVNEDHGNVGIEGVQGVTFHTLDSPSLTKNSFDFSRTPNKSGTILNKGDWHHLRDFQAQTSTDGLIVRYSRSHNFSLRVPDGMHALNSVAEYFFIHRGGPKECQYKKWQRETF